MKSLQILHLEDDALDADLVRREVARLNVDPQWISATSAGEFFTALDQGGFDAILSDNRVSGIEGIHALKLARERRPDVPFIFVSGNPDPRWAEHCLEAGATDYVPKSQLWRLPSALMRLDHAREAHRLSVLTRSRAMLVDLVSQLSLARTVDDIVDLVRQGARALTGADGATFILRDGDRCHYVDEDAIAPLWKGGRFPMSACISGWAMLQGRPAVIPDIYADDRIPHEAYRPTFVKSLVMVPIRAAAPIGAIGAYWASHHEATADEVALVQALADSTSLAFENVARIDTLELQVRERTAALMEANKELEAFSYSVAHDLRAPLRAIQGYGDLLATEVQPPLCGQAEQFLHTIRQSAERMDTLIEDMLTLSKVTRAEVRLRPVDLAPTARDILETLRAASPERQVEVSIHAPLRVQGDLGLLRLAFENLLSNAWKFTGHTAQARIEVATEVQPDGFTVLSVRDNGAGFDMQYAHQLFEPFRRLHRASEFPGTGVGLAIVRRVAQKHGGEVWVKAERGAGATFFMRLPLPAADAQDSAPLPLQTPRQP